MAHYAKVADGFVVEVIVAEQDFIDTRPSSETWVQTSYNTRGGVHYQPDSATPSSDQSKALRKNFAGVGFVYDSVRDAFYAAQPHASWTLNETTCYWEPPVAHPSDNQVYEWNEVARSWDVVTPEGG